MYNNSFYLFYTQHPCPPIDNRDIWGCIWLQRMGSILCSFISLSVDYGIRNTSYLQHSLWPCRKEQNQFQIRITKRPISHPLEWATCLYRPSYWKSHSSRSRRIFRDFVSKCVTLLHWILKARLHRLLDKREGVSPRMGFGRVSLCNA